jgi:hypothetical protein
LTLDQINTIVYGEEKKGGDSGRKRKSLRKKRSISKKRKSSN